MRPAHPGEEKGLRGRQPCPCLPEVRGDAVGGTVAEEAYVPRLRELYHREVVPLLMERFGYKNVMQVPRLEKIVLNIGVGEATQNPSSLDGAMADLAAIAGQKPAVRRAKKSISNFKLRKGMAIGCTVTLRRDRMYEFLDRLVTFALPRVRDFQGLSTSSFDGRGNYTLGVREQIVFPEIDYDRIDKVRGLNVTIVTTARTDEEALVLLRALGMPFRE
ncbi:MAG TPA: 50S ribosomal protein L5 [Candidatus Latescibacteria bacterium]|nr:50S ribosomal protein L5 [Candidatus Latescibacterota bacterium]